MTKANDILLKWLEEAEAESDGHPILAPDAKDLVAGFAGLEPEQQKRLMEVMSDRGVRTRDRVVQAIGSSKDTTALEENALRVWQMRGSEWASAGERFVELALPVGRGAEAAALIVKLQSFSNYPGLAKKLDSILVDYALDERMLDIASMALEWGAYHSSSSFEIWGLSAFLLKDGQPRHLRGVEAAAFGSLDIFNGIGSVGRLIDIIEKYGQTKATETLATRLRALDEHFAQY